MVTEHRCPKCEHVFETKQKLNRHLKKKYPCDQGKCACDKCHKRFRDKGSLSDHKKHRCPGHPPVSVEEKDKQIHGLQTALEALGGMGETAVREADSRPINVNVNINPVFNTDITNIQNNITVNVAGQENIDYIRAMSYDGFKDALGGMNPHHSTMSKLFKLVRINEDHPENHNLLLPDRDGDMVHWKSKDGWKSIDYKEKIRSLLHSDIVNVLDTKVRGPNRDDTFYWGFIIHEILKKCGEIDHVGLKPIYDDIRDPLHDQTMKYVKQFRDAIKDEPSSSSGVTTEPKIAEAAEILSLEDVHLLMNKLQMIEKRLTDQRLTTPTS